MEGTMIHHNSAVPLYLQLAGILSDMIYQGKYKAGDKLPSEHDLCEQFEVSRITVRQALTLLVQKDLAFSSHGKGTFVKNPAINHELNKIISFNKVLQQKGLSGYTQIRSFYAETDCQKAKSILNCHAANLNLIGYASYMPVVYYRSFFAPELGTSMWNAAKAAEDAGSAFSTYDLYAAVHVSIFKIEQTISAVNADEELAQIMDLPKDKAVMVLESVYKDANEAPLEYKLGFYRSDIYSFFLQRQI